MVCASFFLLLKVKSFFIFLNPNFFKKGFFFLSFFKTKTNMKIKTVTIEKPLYSPNSKYGFTIDKGAVSQLHLITEPMASFLKLEYIKDPQCLSGDIIALFELRKVDFVENNRREFES